MAEGVQGVGDVAPVAPGERLRGREGFGARTPPWQKMALLGGVALRFAARVGAFGGRGVAGVRAGARAWACGAWEGSKSASV